MAGIYVHIPFCRQACTYCNFHFSTALRGKDEMLRAIAREADLRAPEMAGQKIETVYIGGGTPSLLTPDEVARLLEKIFEHYSISSLRECTLEANPDDLTPAYLRSLRSLTPVDRFSIGVQSFRDSDLRYTHRAHDARQAERSIKAAQDAGFANLSIDLIYGIPGLGDEAWRENLAKAEAFGVDHLSSYALTVEEGTLLHHQIEKKKATPVNAAQSAQQFRILMQWAGEAGYEHYEISNLARPGHRAVHNTAYWQGAPYLGLGPSAHSFDGAKKRRWNVANNALYTRGILDRDEVIFEEEILTPADRLNEYIMTSLRTVWGCDLHRVAEEWSSKAAEELRKESAPSVARGWMVAEGSVLRLTDDGKLFADRIAGELFQ